MNPRFPLEFAAYRLGTAAVRALPLPVAQRLAAASARRIFARGGKRVRWTLTNLRLAFPDRSEEELRAIGRESYVHFAWNLLDFARLERWTEEEMRARLRWEGLEHVRGALELGRGALGLTLHQGNFELGISGLPLNGIPTAAVARPMRNSLLYRRVLAQRSRNGTVIIATKNAVRPILRALRDGKIVGIVNDQYSGRSKGVYAPLFGYRCLTAAGVATLALRTDAPVLPAFVIREGPDRHLVRFEPPLTLPRTGDVERDIVESTSRMNAALEGFIRAHPEQWLWGHRRFRRSPDLPGNPYESGS
jgi:KDO2-lipid IV(A) lauroyltransferase